LSLSGGAATAAAQAQHKSVLIIYDENRDFPGLVLLDQNLTSTLKAGTTGQLDIYSEYMDLSRFSDENHRKLLRDFYQQKYQGKKIDLILTVMGPSLNFMLEYGDELFPRTPIVFCGIDKREIEGRNLGPNVTGVLVKRVFKPTLELALRLQPDIRQVVFIRGTSDFSKYWGEQAREELREFEGRVTITDLSALSMDDILQKVARLPPHTIVLYLHMFRDGAGNSFQPDQALSLIAEKANAPIYVFLDQFIGKGALGGHVYSMEAQGVKAGELGLRILGGESPSNIAVHDEGTNVDMFDWRQLRRWEISASSLPPGSIVRFKEPTFWDQYKWRIIGVISLCIIEALLIIWLLINRARRRQAQRDSERFAELAKAGHRRLDEVVSNVPGMVWEITIEPDSGKQKTEFMSRFVEQMLGYRAEDFLCTSGFGLSLIPEGDRERVERETNEIFAAGISGTIQYRWLTRDGRLLWVEAQLAMIRDEHNKPIGLRGVTMDITDRKLAEESLRQSEERNHAILRAIPDLMFLQSREGTYLDYHATDSQQLLVPPAGFLGKNMGEVLPPELAERFMGCFERAEQTGEPQVMEYSLPIQDEERWYEARIVLSDGDKVLSMVRDVTDRRSAEEGALRSEERFAKAFRANPQPMSLTRLGDGCYLDVNASFLTMSGYTREEVIGRTSIELGIWDTPGARSDFVQLLKEHGAIHNLETKFRTKSGSFRLLLSSAEQFDVGGEQCVLVASSDITERHRAEEELRQSEERFRNMADTAPVLIWIAGPDKLCTYFNHGWLEFTGRPIEQELGKGWAEGIYSEDYARCLDIYNSAFDRREPFKMEYRLRRADGIFRWMYDCGTPRVSSTGEFLGYIGSCIDIADRKEAEEALQQALSEVNQLTNQLHEENIYLQEEIKLAHNVDEIIGRSNAIKYVLFKVEQVSQTDSTVLILGETGTGKELVARAIHSQSPRKDRPLVKVNCAALSASLIESELFGHEKGSFTGASARKIGRFELADGATLFLDEIGELPLELQSKLLRVIQEGEFERLGSSRTIKVDVRIIAATNRNMKTEIEKGAFREDLWYRLNVFPITVPPLRQRKEDIPPMVEHLVSGLSKKLGKRITSISSATLQKLQDYSWPGNVRELANVIERGVINAQGPVLHIADQFEQPPSQNVPGASRTLDEIEKEYIMRILEDTAWRIEGPNGAARILGLNPSTLRTRMVKLGIQKSKHTAAGGNGVSH
jgi:PAS domain S-box-containing protein